MNSELRIRRKKIAGFTLMEIVVATTIFAIVATAMMSMFNYVLQINRRGEALRQATQGMRNFVEFLVKEVRNGQINYGLIGGGTPRGFAIGPCGNGVAGSNYYTDKTNKIGIYTPTGEEECLYFADASGNQIASNVYVAPSDQRYTLVLEKSDGVKEVLNPPNFKIEELAFFVRPVCDPFDDECDAYNNDFPGIQPMVNINIKFSVSLPTGEVVPIYYQTSISTDKYDIPNG
jgi:prepilin-type N-terminal cleavage/methylation domain-containing protein